LEIRVIGRVILKEQKMRRFVFLTINTLLITILVLGSFFFLGCAKKSEPNEVKIGAIFPLSGKFAQYGNYWKQGLELALENATETGLIEKGKVRIIIEDGETDPRKSVDAFKKLSNIDKVVACIPGTSSVILAIKPIANQKEIVLLNASAISTEIEDTNDFVFSVIPSAYYTGRFLAEAVYNNLGKRNAGILYRDDQSGESFRRVFSERFRELGGKIVYEEPHPRDETDYRSYIAKIKSVESMDILFVASWGNDVAYYVKQATEQGVKKTVLAYETFYTPKVLEIAGNAAEGVFFSAPAFDEHSTQLESLRAKLNERYGHEELNYHVAGHYDAMMIILTAISKGDRTGDDIRKTICSMKTFKGITGDIVFDDKGGASIPLAIYTVKDGKFIRYGE
jgi:branched-chain amino acid transport system substrate-binding protein